MRKISQIGKSMFIFIYSPFYTEVRNEFAMLIPRHSAKATRSYLRICWRGGEPFATLCKIWPATWWWL